MLFSLHAAIGVVHQGPDKRKAFLDHRAALALALEADHTIVVEVDEDVEALLDIVRVDAVANGALADRDAGELASQGGRQGIAYILDVHVANLVSEPGEEGHRILPSDERVAGV